MKTENPEPVVGVVRAGGVAAPAWASIRRETPAPGPSSQPAATREARRPSAYLLSKRLVDVAGSGLGLLLLAPAFTLIALAVKLCDGGPVLFWQTRVGEGGREFRFPKFRSMICDAEKARIALEQSNQHGAAGVTFKMRRDPRVTPVGRVLRRYSLDELPQLWCVFTGEMSLVGPRPALPKEVARYSDSDRRRLAVKPGLTCIWQVSGRADVPFPEQVEMDVEYIEKRSLLLDLRLLLATVPALLSGRGAY